MHPKYADGMANSVDPDKTEEVVWSGSKLFAYRSSQMHLPSMFPLFTENQKSIF